MTQGSSLLVSSPSPKDLKQAESRPERPNESDGRSLSASSLDALGTTLERYPLFLGFCLLYVPIFFFLASQKLIWDDEFFSLYIARGGFAEIREALLTGADQHPPLFYWLTYLSLLVFGENHIALRLPALLGVLLAAYALYRLVGKRAGPLFGIAAALLVVNSYAFIYAYEARGYGPMLGFSALAILFWSEVREPQKRLRSLIGLALSLFAAVSCHYYGIGIFGVLFVAEAVRIYETRKIDLLSLLALGAGLMPLVVFYEIIESAQAYSEHFWAKPRFRSILSFFTSQFFYTSLPAVIFSGLFIAYLYRGGCLSTDRERPAFTKHELVLVLGLLALPIITVLAAKLVGKGYHQRYSLQAVIGWSWLTVMSLAWLTSSARSAALLLCIALICSTLGYSAWHVRDELEDQDIIREMMIYLNAQEPRDLPIAVAEISPMHQMSFYAPKELADRLYFLTDAQSSIHYLDHDTIDNGVMDLQPWFIPFQAVSYEEFVKQNEEFLLYGYIGPWSWITYRLPREDRLQTELVGRTSKRVLMLSYRRGTDVETLQYSRRSPHAMYRDVTTELKFSPQEWESSFCSRWMDDAVCRLGSK